MHTTLCQEEYRLGVCGSALLRGVPMSSMTLPFYSSGVSAGFPSPADDFAHRPLDLHTHCVANPAATFFLTVEGDGSQGLGLRDGDTLIVDRSKAPVHESLVVAVVEGEQIVYRADLMDGGQSASKEEVKGGLTLLDVDGSALDPDVPFEIWGVVTYIVRRLR